jgi:hypothetical protein
MKIVHGVNYFIFFFPYVKPFWRKFNQKLRSFSFFATRLMGVTERSLVVKVVIFRKNLNFLKIGVWDFQFSSRVLPSGGGRAKAVTNGLIG